jgi:hypothetical protein
MSQDAMEPDAQGNFDGSMDADEYGGLSLEDDPGGTVNPADLAGTASGDDAEVGYDPEFSEADEQPE